MALSVRLIVVAVLIGVAVWSARRPDDAGVARVRQIQFHLDVDDPIGVYRIDLTDEHADRIDDDVKIDLPGRHIVLDRAFLDGALPSFHHRGRVIGTIGDPSIPVNRDGLRVRIMKSLPREIWYYIGPDDQFVLLRQQLQENDALRTTSG